MAISIVVLKFVIMNYFNSQLKSCPEIYEGYVPMAYTDYLKKMSKYPSDTFHDLFLLFDCLIGEMANWTLWSWHFFGLITGVGNGAIMSLCRLLQIRYVWATSYRDKIGWLLYES